MPLPPRHSFTLLTLLLFAGLPASADAQDSELAPEQVVFFEQRVRPLLADHCFECHGPEKQQAALRLDTRASALEGNESGPAIVPHKPDESRLVQVIRYADDDVQMPPDGKLDAPDIEVLTAWIANGAFWPESAAGETSGHGSIPRRPDGSIDFEQAAEQLWAYRPVEQPRIPDRESDQVCCTPIDRFVAVRLEESGLSLSPEADRRTLIRRATVDLLGILPTYEEVEAFVADDGPGAYEHLVDRLLASPLYGERWARHWLDVARYADTRGYVFTENRFYPFAYTYRDYVIASFNDDKPYDRFVREQIAADQLGLDESDPALAALGFLTVGPRFRNNEHDIIDDRLDVTFRGLMGMTLACARCHDHKYDPIPTSDYYSLYGVFASSFEPEQLPVIGEIDETPAYIAYRTELEKRRQAVEDYQHEKYDELLNQARARAGDHLLALLRDGDQVPGNAGYEHGTPRDKLIALWRDMLRRRDKLEDPVFGPWRLFQQFPADGFQAQVEQWLADPVAQTPDANPLLIALFRESPPASMVDVARLYGQLLSGIHDRWIALRTESAAAPPDVFPDAPDEQLRRVLYGPDSVTDVPFERAEREIFERDNRDRIRELEKKISEWEVESEGAPPRAMVMRDRDRPEEPVIFLRGNSGRRGDRVPRRFPQILNSVSNEQFRNGSGRRELAAAIASPGNPLTARVIVNRVWRHHFGAGIVATPSDFGSRSSPPTHPELLDHLAATFMERGWSLKDLHRRIMLSAVYRQASLDRPDCRAVDPENSLLWRANRRRLEFEAMRDGILFVAGRLDTTMGGRPVDIEARRFTGRRSVYALIDRNNFSGLLRTFDLPTPDSSAPERPNTTVPQQALFALNARFMQRMSSAAAERIGDNEDPAREAFRLVLSRDPLPGEHQLVTDYLDRRPESLAELVQSLLMTNEFMFVD